MVKVHLNSLHEHVLGCFNSLHCFERLKSRVLEKYRNRLAAARRIAEENHAKAGARLNGKTVKTIFTRQIGYLPSFFVLFLIFWVTRECCNHYMRVHWVNLVILANTGLQRGKSV